MTRFLPLVIALWAVAPCAQINTGDPIPQAVRPALASAAGPAGLVVVFWSDACPWTDRYTPRLAALADSYGRAGFGFLLVDSNRPDPTRADQDRQWPDGLAFTQDAEGSVADAFSAVRAPHAFLFGPASTLLYDGAIDDSPASADRVRTPYLAQAMDQSVAGLPVDIQRTQSFGCSIDRTSASPNSE